MNGHNCQAHDVPEWTGGRPGVNVRNAVGTKRVRIGLESRYEICSRLDVVPGRGRLPNPADRVRVPAFAVVGRLKRKDPARTPGLRLLVQFNQNATWVRKPTA